MRLFNKQKSRMTPSQENSGAHRKCARKISSVLIALVLIMLGAFLLPAKADAYSEGSFVAQVGTVQYESLQEAVSNAGGEYVKLLADSDEAVVAERDLFLDLNGKQLTNLTVGGTCYCIDSTATAATAGAGSARITGTMDPDHFAGGIRYVVLEDCGVYTAHVLKLELSYVALRTSEAGLYYKASVQCDDALSAAIDSYGVALSVSAMPGTDFAETELYTRYEGAPVCGEIFTSGSVFGIFKDAGDNAARGAMKIYANAYIHLTNGAYLMSDLTTGDTAPRKGFDGVAWSLKDVLTELNNTFDRLETAEQASLVAFGAAWEDVVLGWGLNNLHEHTEIVDPAVAPTCTQAGMTEGSHCSVCGEVMIAQTEIAANGHIEVIDAAKAPTCTETGLTEGKHCSVCGEVITAQTEIAAYGHRLGIYLTESIALTHTNSGTYPFVNTDGKWYSTNKGNSTSSTYTITIPCNCTVTIEYGVSSESNYDKFTIKKNTTTLATISGSTTGSKILDLVTGDKLTFTYSKDSSASSGSDCGWFKITTPETTIFSQSVTTQNCTDDVYCNVCNKLVYEKLGHNIVTDPGYAATCTATGLAEGSHCARCNEIIVAQTVIPATGHTEVIEAEKKPTCTETGLTEGRYCSVCNEVFATQTEVAALGHFLCLYDDVYIALTHTNATNYPFKNTDGKWYATNAAYSTATYTLTTPADCTVTLEYGISTSYSSDYFDITHNSTRLERLTGTKTATGTVELTAGDTLTFKYYKSGYYTTSAWFEIKDVVATNAKATTVTSHCTQDVICKHCKMVFYPKTGHSPVTDPGHAATCTATGLADGQICSVCNDVITPKAVISPTGHSYTNNTCTVCGYVLTPSAGLTYSLGADGTYSITGLGTCTDKVIVIPANINGKDVTYIAADAFRRIGSFTGLYIPGTVKTIGSSAFEDTYFDFIYMEEGVATVESNAFAGSYGANSLIVIPSARYVGIAASKPA